MTARVRVVGLGQRAAGDDGVGPAVLDALRQRGVPPDVAVFYAAEDSDLVPLLQLPAPVVVVDAVLASPAGKVLDVAPADVDAIGRRALSTHGIGVGQAIALARSLARGHALAPLHIVGITVEPPLGYGFALSPAVAAAVPRAVERVLALVGS